MESSRNWRGIFSRAGPQALVEWYRDHLGDSLTPDDDPPWQQQAGPTAFAPFEQDTRYFGDVGKQWMINFRVGDFDAMMRQLKARELPWNSIPRATRMGGSRACTNPKAIQSHCGNRRAAAAQVSPEI